jgi:hypothetical protein
VTEQLNVQRSEQITEQEIVNKIKQRQCFIATIPAPLEDARFKKPERIIINAHFLLRVIQENVLQHSLTTPSM